MSEGDPSPVFDRSSRAFPLTLVPLLLATAALFQLGQGIVMPVERRLAIAMTLATEALLGIITDETIRTGSQVGYDGFSVQIIGECTGTLEFMILLAFILAYPAAWRDKLYGIAWGGVAIVGFNLMRIVTLVVVGAQAPTYFNFFHVYFWQVTAIAMIGAVFMLWVRWTQQRAA